MKHSILCLLVAANYANAWTVPQPAKEVKKVHKAGWSIPAAFAAFTLATTPVANANELSNAANMPSPTLEQPSLLVAAGAYQAEDSFFSTDLSLPSYNTENSNSLINVKSPDAPLVQDVVPKKEYKGRAPKEETPEQAAKREASEAKAAAKAEERAKEAYERKLAEYNRKKSDLEKAAAAKAEKAVMQQKRLEYKSKE